MSACFWPETDVAIVDKGTFGSRQTLMLARFESCPETEGMLVEKAPSHPRLSNKRLNTISVRETYLQQRSTVTLLIRLVTIQRTLVVKSSCAPTGDWQSAYCSASTSSPCDSWCSSPKKPNCAKKTSTLRIASDSLNIHRSGRCSAFLTRRPSSLFLDVVP